MSELQLLSKFTIGGQELQNRVVLAPLTRARGTPSGDPYDIKSTIPNELMQEYYEQRADHNLMITEATAVSEEAYGWRNAPSITTPQHVKAWKKVVDRVHAKGAVVYLQIWHMGRFSHSSFHPSTNRTVSAGNLPMKSTHAVNAKVKTIHGESVEPEIPHMLTVDEIQTTVQDFVNAAKLAKEAGFDGIEIHGANGYLVDQFLQSISNNRTDEYGGSYRNRYRFLQEIVEGIISSGAFPAHRIGVRISPNGNYGGMGSPDNHEMFTYVAQQLNQYGLAFLELLDGLGYGFHGKDKVVTTHDVRKVFDGPVISNIGHSKETAEGTIRSGAADMVSFGRLYMSNPDLVERFTNDWPTAPFPDPEWWWYSTGAKGYTDFPTYKEELEQKKALEGELHKGTVLKEEEPQLTMIVDGVEA